MSWAIYVRRPGGVFLQENISNFQKVGKKGKNLITPSLQDTLSRIVQSDNGSYDVGHF